MQKESNISTDDNMRRRPSARVGVGAGVIFVTIVVLALAVGGSAWFVRSQAERVERQRAAASAILIAMLDQQTGLRGYFLTHDRSFLEAYERGQESYSKPSERLRSGTAGDRPVSNALNKQQRAARRWQQASKARLGDFEAGGTSEDGSQELKQLMDDFRVQHSSLTSLLADRAREGRVNAQRVPLIIIVVLGMLAAIIGGWFLRVRTRQQEALWEHRERKRLAFELNDSIVQSLVVSSYALSMGDTERAAAALERALTAGKGVISEMLADTDDKTLTRSAPPAGKMRDT